MRFDEIVNKRLTALLITVVDSDRGDLPLHFRTR